MIKRKKTKYSLQIIAQWVSYILLDVLFYGNSKSLDAIHLETDYENINDANFYFKAKLKHVRSFKYKWTSNYILL